MAEDVELPVERAEADDYAAAVGCGAGEIEEQPLGDEHVEEQHLVSREKGFPVAGIFVAGRNRHGGRLIGAHHCTHPLVALIFGDFWFHNMSADERRLVVEFSRSEAVGDDGEEDDGALDRFFPIGFDVEMY